MRALVAALVLLAAFPLLAPHVAACHPDDGGEPQPTGPVWVGHTGCGSGSTACVWLDAQPRCYDLP